MDSRGEERRRVCRLDRPALAALQRERLGGLLDRVVPTNAFYAARLAALPRPLTSLDDLAALPYTFKDELQSTDHTQPFARNLTWAPERYVRCHQTSGTRGRPLVVLDTAEDWQWWLDGWQFVLDVAEVGPADRVGMAFSFGPFIGFWSAYDAAAARGAMVVPAGGLSTAARLELLATLGVTVVCCTPSYALHLAEVAVERGVRLGELAVRVLILAGEPGGSLPAVRQRIERAWQARVVDHAGATEVGPWGFGAADGTGLFVNESRFVAEFLSIEHGRPAAEGELSELVLTTLGRAGSPVFRYRTGDLVRPRWQHGRDVGFVFLEGGVLGRVDDMLIVRGVNVFPSAVEQILHGFPEVEEYRLTATRRGAMDELLVEIEDRLGRPERVADELHLRLGLRVEVRTAALGSLPRFEGKGRRFLDRRHETDA